jgi:hypothetical protein
MGSTLGATGSATTDGAKDLCPPNCDLCLKSRGTDAAKVKLQGRYPDVRRLAMMGAWMMAGFGILLLLAVGLAVALLLRPIPGAGRAVARPSAKELLDQRYAHGEIDDESAPERVGLHRTDDTDGLAPPA